MKKRLGLLMIFTLLLCLCFALSACISTATTCEVHEDNNLDEKCDICDIAIPHTHTLKKISATTPTCKDIGNIEHYKCTGCNELFSDADGKNSITDVTVPAAHTGGTEIRNAKAATEETEGYTGDTYCLGCNEKLESGTTINKLSHTHNITKVDAKNATCTENGNIEYWICTKCDKVYSDENIENEISEEDTVIPAQHNLTYNAKHDESCTENGSIEHWHCSVCEKNYSEENATNKLTDIIIPASHKLTHFPASAETCTQNGNVEYWHCSVCGKNFSDENAENELDSIIIPASHKYENNKCTVCGDLYFTKGLAYTLNSDKTSYKVTGIGTATDRDIVIPSTYNNMPVTSIGNYAFEDRSNLTSISIPDSVTTISGSAFYGCTSLTNIEIPNSVTSIGNYAFSGCTSLANISVDENNTAYKDIDGNLYSKDGKTLIQYAIGKTNTEFTILDSVTTIGGHAFYGCSSLEKVTFEENSQLKYIGYYAFRGCSSLTSITIPDSVTSIGDSAFCGCTSLTGITIPNSVTSIAGSLFQYCSSLINVTIPGSVESIGAGAFIGCSSLTSITIPNSVRVIGNKVFQGCTSLTIYCVVESELSGWNSYWNYLDSIDDFKTVSCPVVWDCNNNEVADNRNIYAVIDGIRYTLNNGNNTATIVKQPSNIITADIPATVTYKSITYSVTSIAYNAFSGCSSLTSVTISSSITSIGNSVFSGCTSLTSITIPNSVTSIGYSAFSNCTSLTSITIPNSVTFIENLAFRDCTSLTIYCVATSKPSGWRSNWNYSVCPVVWNCNNNDIADDGYIYTAVNGIRYSLKDNEATVARQPSNIVIDNISETVTYKNITYSVTSISSYAFYNCYTLTSVTIPDSVTSIGSYAFYNCTSLNSVMIGNSVSSIGEEAFRGCTSLESVTFGENSQLETIGSYAFSGCTSLTSVIIPYKVTSIGNYTFSGCTSLANISVDENNTAYKDIDGNLYSKDGKTLIQYAIGKTDKSFNIPNSVTSIISNALYGCTSLNSVTISDSVTKIGDFAFYGCTSLTDVYYTGTEEEWAAISIGSRNSALTNATIHYNYKAE